MCTHDIFIFHLLSPIFNSFLTFSIFEHDTKLFFSHLFLLLVFKALRKYFDTCLREKERLPYPKDRSGFELSKKNRTIFFCNFLGCFFIYIERIYMEIKSCFSKNEF